MKFPIKEQYKITQRFGESLLDYSKFNLKAHNGLDIACFRGAGVYAPVDGLVVESTDGAIPETGGYGNIVRVRVSDNVPNSYFETIFAHLLKTEVKVGDKVTEGTLLGLVDSTGFSTGDHLHFGVRRLLRQSPKGTEVSINYLGEQYVIPDYTNGYLGYIDPQVFLDTYQESLYAVDLRYGSPYSSIREALWALRYKEAYVRKEAAKAGFGVLQFEQIKKAFVYGYWDRETVFSPAMFAVWSIMTKPEYLKRKQSGTQQAGTNPFSPTL